MGFELSRVTARSSFRPYTSKQVGDTGPAELTWRRNSHAFRSSFSGARGTNIELKNRSEAKVVKIKL